MPEASGHGGRLGGNEFAVLLEHVEGAEEAVGVAQRIHGALRAPCALGTHEAFVEASIGVAVESGAPGRPGELLRSADRALYGAKREGKRGYSVASPSSDPIAGRE